MSAENLLLALDKEYQLLHFYSQASVWGAPLSNLQSAKEAHSNALVTSLQQRGIEIPADTNQDPIALPNTLEEVLQMAVERENDAIAFYNTLIDSEQDPEALDIFYRLQAISYNNHIPTLQSSLLQIQNSKNLFSATSTDSTKNQQNIQNTMEMLNNGKEILNETGEIIAQLKDGSLNQEQLESFLNKLNYSLMGGVIAGAFGVIILNEFLNHNKE